MNSFDMNWNAPNPNVDLIEQRKHPIPSLGFAAIVAAAPPFLAAVDGVLKLLKSTGKSGRADFFSARDQISDQLFLAFANQAGYDFDAMHNYWMKYNDRNRPVPPGPEKEVVDKWMAELNAKRIGGDAASANNLSVQSISLKKFDFAYPLLEQAAQTFASKYMSGGTMAIKPKQTAVAAASTKMTPEGKTILWVTGGLAGLLLVTAGLKHFNVI